MSKEIIGYFTALRARALPRRESRKMQQAEWHVSVLNIIALRVRERRRKINRMNFYVRQGYLVFFTLSQSVFNEHSLLHGIINQFESLNIKIIKT
jgi:hypothetical protein